MDVHLLQLWQSAACARPATGVPGNFAADAPTRAPRDGQFDAGRADGPWMVLSECGDAVRGAGSGNALDRSHGADPTPRSAHVDTEPERLRGPATGGHVLFVEQMARRRP